MPKENCKYGTKCYQKNEHHLQKYNHPKNESDETAGNNASTDNNKESPPKHKRQQLVSIVDETASENKQIISDKQHDMEQQPTSTTTNNGEATVSVNREEFKTDELRKEALGNIAGKNYMEILHKRIKLSVQKEYDDLLSTNEFIRHKFLVEMPTDFYEFWKFLGELKKDTAGEAILQYLKKQFQLELVGPFEYLAGRFHNAKIREPGDYLRHWRFFYDPPEFQTIFVRKDTGIHYGYWRDTPQDKEKLLIARNDASKGCEFEFIVGNVFDAFLYYLEKDFSSTPFTAAAVNNTKKQLQKYIDTNAMQLEKLEPLQKLRNSKVVTKTFHRLGIVVPFERKSEVGYRPLTISDADLKKILKLFETAGDNKDDCVKTVVMEKLQPLATAANIAADEGDFGTILELGIDLFCSGRLELHMLIQSLLVPAYSLLHRPQFIAISKAHLEKRSKNFHLSIFQLDEN